MTTAVIDEAICWLITAYLLTTCCEAPGEDEDTGRVITLDDLRQEDEYYKYERGEDRE